MLIRANSQYTSKILFWLLGEEQKSWEISFCVTTNDIFHNCMVMTIISPQGFVCVCVYVCDLDNSLKISVFHSVPAISLFRIRFLICFWSTSYFRYCALN